MLKSADRAVSGATTAPGDYETGGANVACTGARGMRKTIPIMKNFTNLNVKVFILLFLVKASGKIAYNKMI